MNILSSLIFYILAYAPAFIIPIIVSKIIFSDKFKNKYFISILCILLIITIIHICLHIYWIGYTNLTDNQYTVIQKINIFSSNFLAIALSLSNIIILVLAPIIVIYTIIEYIKNKNTDILTKLFVSLSVFTIMFYIGLPAFISQSHISSASLQDDNYNTYKDYLKYKKAADLSLISPLKYYYSELAAMCALSVYFDKYSNKQVNPDISSKEAQIIINNYIKYATQAAELSEYTKYLVIAAQCIIFEKFDLAIDYAKKYEKYGNQKADSILSEIYIAKGEYETALKYANEAEYKRTFYKYDKLCRIYTGLNDFEKAHEYLDKMEEEQQNCRKCTMYRTFIYNKEDKKDLALDYYKKAQEQYSRYKNVSFDDFIKSMDRITF